MKDLMQKWQECGLEKGDVFLLHSNITRTLLLNKRLKLEEILQSFLLALGENGTLLLPLFNFDFTKGIIFDIRNTPSKMGSLTEFARTSEGFYRSKHPIYSFAIYGKYAQDFAKLENKSAYSEDSPFGLLRELDGKVGVLDLEEQHSMTFYHHCEECHNVQWRYHKDFSGFYLDENGEKSYRTYSIFVRDLKRGVKTFVNPMGELLWKNGIYTGCRPKEKSGLRIAKVRKIYEFVSKIIQEDKALGLLYRIEN